MKTTVEISDVLLTEARKLAAREGTTLRAIVEQGLKRVLDERRRTKDFKLQDGSFRGKGLQHEFAEAGWDRLRQAIYEGRGG